MSRRMDGYRRAAGLGSNRKKGPRRETLWELVKRAFSYERSTGIAVSYTHLTLPTILLV